MVLGHSRHGGKALYVEMLNSVYAPKLEIQGPDGVCTGIVTEHAQVSATSKDLQRRVSVREKCSCGNEHHGSNTHENKGKQRDDATQSKSWYEPNRQA